MEEGSGEKWERIILGNKLVFSSPPFHTDTQRVAQESVSGSECREVTDCYGDYSQGRAEAMGPKAPLHR